MCPNRIVNSLTSLFTSVSFFFVFLDLCCLVHTLSGLLYLLGGSHFIVIQCLSLYLEDLFSLKSIWSEPKLLYLIDFL